MLLLVSNIVSIYKYGYNAVSFKQLNNNNGNNDSNNNLNDNKKIYKSYTKLFRNLNSQSDNLTIIFLIIL